MSDNIKILKNYLLYFLVFVLVCLIGITDVFGVSITDYATRYDYGNANSTTIYQTNYRTDTDNRLTLYPGTAPTYADSETFNGFYNRINYSITKGTNYLVSLKVSMSSLSDTEIGTNNINNRLLNINFAHCSSCAFTGVSGSIRRYNSSAPVGNNLFDFVVTINYSFVATETTNQFYLGTYTGDDRTLGIYEHNYTSVVMVTDLDISSNNDATIINQNDTIINQNNQIIEQNNQNTQNIINNQNENTQEQIDSQKVCSYIDKKDILTDNKILTSNGSTYDSNGYGITDYINIKKSTIKVITSIPSGYGIYMCFYNTNKTLISCSNSGVSSDTYLEIPNNSSYFRASINKSQNRPTYEICIDGNQALNDNITDLNDSINDDDSSGATSEASEFFSSFTTNTFGLTSIITAPLNLIQSLTSSTCSELHLPLPYLNNKYLDLPCMTSIYQTHFGAFFTMYQTITYGIIAYWICVRIFNQVKDFKNPEHDEIEVVDL